MGKNGYLERKRAMNQGFLDVGEQLGMQKMWDYIQLTLRDPDVMGKDTLPCDGCTEKFTACHSRCPKDLRGEFGYSAWTAKCQEIAKKRKEYLDAVRRRKPW